MRPNSGLPARLFGLAMMIAGIAGWYYNRHLAATEGAFYIRLCVFAPLGVFGGLLILLRPDWIGPIRKDSSRAQKTSLCAVLGLMAVFSGLDMYTLTSRQHPQPSKIIHWTPEMGTPK